MKKYIKIAVLVLVALVFIGTFVFLYQKSQPKETVYDILIPEVTDLIQTTVATGKIEPRDEVEIKPQISGIIAEVYKEAGQTVRKGEVIAKVKVIPELGTLNSAESRVRLAEINGRQAETDLGRMEKLYESTIDGLILDVPIKVGNSVIMSNTFNDGTTIATVADMGDLIFRGNVDETEVGRIREGIPVKITLGALQNMRFNANLEYISPKSVENNGANQFEIKAAISVPDSITIRSGYSANAEMVLQRANQVVAVPESAIEFSGDSTFVYVMTDSLPAQKFERRPVVTGISDGIKIEIKQGLKTGEPVRGLKKEQ